MSSARAIATARVTARVRRFPDLDPSPLETNGLDRRDAALARAIDQAVARRWLTLQSVLATQLHRPWAEIHAPVKAALLIGAAQLLLLDRLPDHAVINEAVAGVQSRAGGLVNAVLRRIAELRAGCREPVGIAYSRDELPRGDGRVMALRSDVFASDPLERLAQQTSHPVPLLARWRDRLGPKRMASVARHDLVRPPVILANVDPVPDGCEPHGVEGFAVLRDTGRLDEILRAHPATWVQDPGAAVPVQATAELTPGLIIDVCAGRGTKTRQLARLHRDARIIATDRNPARLETLREVFSAEPRVQVVEIDRLVEWAGRADLVVVDAPCSNTAALARRVEARYRFGDRTLETLVGVQRQIVADGIGLLTDEGFLLYSTCSLEREENDEMAEWITRWHPLQERGRHLRCPAGQPGDPPAAYADGSFVALLQRRR